MNVEIRTEAAQLLFWEYINRNFFPVCFVISVHSQKLARREDLIARRIREKPKLGARLELHHPRRIKFTIAHFCGHLTISVSLYKPSPH
jgi:hypothetical protein